MGCRITLKRDSASGRLTPFDSGGCHVNLKKIHGNRLQNTAVFKVLDSSV